jgi:hypothetical protein
MCPKIAGSKSFIHFPSKTRSASHGAHHRSSGHGATFSLTVENPAIIDVPAVTRTQCEYVTSKNGVAQATAMTPRE